jgi:hypothetical protein
VYPAFALLAGLCLAGLLHPTRLARLRQLAPRLALAAAVVLLCLPVPLHLDDARPTRELGAVLAALTPPHAPVAAYGEVQLFWRGQMHFYLDRDVERLPSLSALEDSGAPLVLCFLEPCRDLERAGWRPHIESWRWTAYLRPGLARPGVPGASAAAGAQTELVSRRLE